MAPKLQHIINLKPTMKGGPLVARVIRAWDVYYNLNSPISLDMLLHDDQVTTPYNNYIPTIISVAKMTRTYRGEPLWQL